MVFCANDDDQSCGCNYATFTRAGCLAWLTLAIASLAGVSWFTRWYTNIFWYGTTGAAILHVAAEGFEKCSPGYDWTETVTPYTGIVTRTLTAGAVTLAKDAENYLPGGKFIATPIEKLLSMCNKKKAGEAADEEPAVEDGENTSAASKS